MAKSRTGIVKVTIDLPDDIVTKIDKMAAVALFGSRGRTIQALVDAVIDCEDDIKLIGQHIANLQRSQATDVNDPNYTAMLFSFIQIANRISRFLPVGVLANQEANQGKTNQQEANR